MRIFSLNLLLICYSWVISVSVIGFAMKSIVTRHTLSFLRNQQCRRSLRYSSKSNSEFRIDKSMKMSSAGDTIYALSSGPMVKSGVAVIRISGPSAEFCLQQLLAKDNSEVESAAILPKPRNAALRKLRSPTDRGEILDQALVLRFPSPRSFTGEDVVELHVHGSRAVVTGVFDALAHLDSPEQGRAIRPAEAGEFTQRAFANGKMDLTEVEGLSDLLDADTSEQRKQALKQMEGHMRIQYEKWRCAVISQSFDCICEYFFNWIFETKSLT